MIFETSMKYCSVFCRGKPWWFITERTFLRKSSKITTWSLHFPAEDSGESNVWRAIDTQTSKMHFIEVIRNEILWEKKICSSLLWSWQLHLLYSYKHEITESVIICSTNLPDLPVKQIKYQVVLQIIYQKV